MSHVTACVRWTHSAFTIRIAKNQSKSFTFYGNLMAKWNFLVWNMTFNSHEIYYYFTTKSFVPLQIHIYLFSSDDKSVDSNLCLSEFDLTIKWSSVSIAFGVPFNGNELEGNLSFHHHLHSHKKSNFVFNEHDNMMVAVGIQRMDFNDNFFVIYWWSFIESIIKSICAVIRSLYRNFSVQFCCLFFRFVTQKKEF